MGVFEELTCDYSGDVTVPVNANYDRADTLEEAMRYYPDHFLYR